MLLLQGDRYTLSQQVVNFETTLGQLRSMMSPGNLTQLLSNSIVVMVFGSNDYINNYLMPNIYASRRTYTPEAFANTLLNRYALQIHALYSLGLRKFFIPGIGPLGCIPNQLATGQAPAGRCVDSVNQMLGPFNEGLKKLIDRFNDGSHPGAIFVYGNTYGVFGDILNNPARYGFTVRDTACCGVGRNQGQMTCLPLQTPCFNRDQYVFWDAFHPTQAANAVLAQRAYSGSSTDCYPINVQQLAQFRLSFFLFLCLSLLFVIRFGFSASLPISLLVLSFYYVMAVPGKRTADDAASSSVVVPIGGRRKCRRLDSLSVLPQYLNCGDCSWNERVSTSIYDFQASSDNGAEESATEEEERYEGYEVYQTTVVGLGHSTCVAIGGDHFNGTNFIDCMRKFIVDPHTEDVCTISWLTGRSLQRVNQRLKDRCRASRAVEIALLKKLNKSMEYAFGENGANSIKHFVSPICNNVRWVASGQSFHLQMVYKCYTT
ncbi:unnamed protein product [Lactuca virosa]|uniref:Uncharacterized protein n=1 Tax=Lactuca virosa TaxID=75947 RepID=A0AAU9M883_9ASTR|nr:unnamed protein product [Lactuca virosa]